MELQVKHQAFLHAKVDNKDHLNNQVSKIINEVIEIVSYIEYAATLRLKDVPSYDTISLSMVPFDLRSKIKKCKEKIIIIFTLILEGRIPLIEKLIKMFDQFFVTKFGEPGPQNKDHLIELFQGSIKMIMYIEEKNDI